MPQHQFEMRLSCRYQGADNTPVDPVFELMTEQGPEPFALGFSTPGFLVFVYAVLNCQHLYLRVNAAERGHRLSEAVGHLRIATDADWRMQRLAVHFDLRTAGSTPDAGDLDYFKERMRACPVSVNLREPAESSTTLTLLDAAA
jgi:hypothetical protein